MKDMDIVTDQELGSKSYGDRKPDRKPSGDDPIADKLLSMYYFL